MRNHVWPVIGDRPIGRVTAHEIEALIGDLWRRLRAQAVHVRQALQLLLDFAIRRDLIPGGVNPVRKIAEDLPRRRTGTEANYARVTTIEDARAVLRAVEASGGTAFGKLAHRLIALTAVRKREGLEARWSEVAETADGMVWTIPAARMKGKTGHRREHVIPLAPQAADVFRAARALQAATGNVSEHVFPGQRRDGPIEHAAPCRLLNGALTRIGMEGRHTIHGWRGTFSTILNEADPGAGRVIDVMLAHKTFGEVEGRYNKASFVAQRRALATVWADQLLEGAASAMAVAGLEGDRRGENVVQLREAA
jgi:integrase